MKIIVTIIFTINSLFCDAQIVLDTAYMRCYYAYNYVRDTTDVQKQIKETMILQIGKKTSKFYSYKGFMYDSIIATGAPVIITSTVNNVIRSYHNPAYLNYTSTINQYRIYKNYPENMIAFTDHFLDNLYYEENIPIQKWAILHDTATISGYKCQKAICEFRGRYYEAWFTSEIQVDDGPYKFGGLPGLIIQIGDTKLHHIFQLINIEKTHELIVFEKRDYVKTNRIDYTKILRRFFSDPMGFMDTKLGGTTISSNPQSSYIWNNDVIERDIK
jgi:GLPGLI family protein